MISKQGVIRGLHVKNNPHGQAKLIRVVQGHIYDVAVDLADSFTYGEWFGVELSAENQTQLYLPKGFAHGYGVLSKKAIVQYKVDAPYSLQAETGIRYDDPNLGIDWQVDNPVLSEKDLKLPFLKIIINEAGIGNWNNGQLGLALQGAAKDSTLALVFMDKNALDITDTQAVKEVFTTQSFDVCINAAAYTDVDGAETNKELAYLINATAVETLAKACKQHECWLIHISTDYVFDGALNRPYSQKIRPIR